MNKTPTIHVLGPERHGGWCSIGPHSALADLIDENNEHVMAYIKPFPIESRGCFNEISRWLGATTIGISTAPKIWIHLLSPERAREAWPHKSWPEHPIICFASAEIMGDIADCRFQTDSPILVEILKNWAMLYPLIALDMWFDNIDCHIGNLLWAGGNDFVAIDGSECFTGQFWTATQINSPSYSINKLVALLGELDDLGPSIQAQKQIMTAVQSHNAVLIVIEPELQIWARRLIGPDDCDLPLQFLKQNLGLKQLTH